MARISLTPPASAIHEAMESRFQEALGISLDPVTAMAHQPQVLEAIAELEQRAATWDALGPELKELAVMAAAVKIGCGWCIDFGHWVGVTHGIPADTIEAVPTWRDSDLFSDLERLVLEYAEAMSDTPPTVTDDMVTGLLQHLTEAQLVELTTIIAVENQRARINDALGITAQGFKQYCEIPVGP